MTPLHTNVALGAAMAASIDAGGEPVGELAAIHDRDAFDAAEWVSREDRATVYGGTHEGPDGARAWAVRVAHA